MIVYGGGESLIAWRALAEHVVRNVDEVRAKRDLDAVRRLLIDFGEFESSVADSLNPDLDKLSQTTALLRETGLRTGRLLLCARRGLDIDDADLDFISSATYSLEECSLPELVERRVSEGYAYYSLYP